MSSHGAESVIKVKLEKHFFQALDGKQMPQEYRNALQKNDRDTALKAAVKYFRSRPVPAYFADLKSRAFDINTALRAMRGDVTVVDIPYQFSNGKIDFDFNPTSVKGVFNPEWHWQLNRMYFWNDMALAYLKNGDEKIAEAFSVQVYDWVTKNHRPEVWKARGSAWRTIEAGLRLMGSWQTAFEVFRKSPSVPDETLALMLSSMHEQAFHAFENRTRRNWLMMELNGIHTFAVLFPEFSASSMLRKKSSALLGEELKTQILPDGMQCELSPDYHLVVFNCAANLYRIAKIEQTTGDLPPYYAPLLERAADAALKLMTPGFTQPRTNDCFTMPTKSYMRRVIDFFPHRKDFLWANSSGKEGTPPAGKTASRFLPWAGFAAMRTSWSTDAAYLCFDVGPLGENHFHQDKLNINFFKGKEELLFDDGGGHYEVSPFRKYGTSAYDHNTVLVDGNGQYRTGPKSVTEPIDAKFVSNEKFDYACGIYDDTFGPDMTKPAAHKREVLFIKPDIFAVADTMTSTDGKSHDYTMLLQLDTLNVKTSTGHVHGVLNGKYDFYAVLLSPGVEVKAESGLTDPVSGWFVGRKDKALHPASTVKITAKQKKDFRFLTLLFPLKKGDAAPKVKKISPEKWEISFNGKSYQINLQDLVRNL